jgi:transcriptional regulator with XRE-family HTH domain
MNYRAELAGFLRSRREALQPSDVGLPARQYRRTRGLRREDVAQLCGMSTDYYERLEQQRGPRPSAAMTAAIARGLRLTLDERDYLFHLVGHSSPARDLRGDHIAPGLMRVLDRLQDTPALIMTCLGETLMQTEPALALLGDETRYTGLERSALYRWFTVPQARLLYPPEDHDEQSRIFTTDLRAASRRGLGTAPRAQSIVTALLERSPEFAELWSRHEVRLRRGQHKRLIHPQVGNLEVHCQMLTDAEQSQCLLVFTATPGTPDYEKLEVLTVLGRDRIL